jgi:DNA/RNA-binding domain of Phe-tRNA-synthetase-like protein
MNTQFDLLRQYRTMPHTRAELQAILSSATVSSSIFTLRPDYQAHLVAATNLPGGPSNERTEQLLQEAEAHAKALLKDTSATSLPHIAAWREAYKSFNAKPNKTRNSLEALTRRLASSPSDSSSSAAAALPRINALTDLYNAVSVRYQIPLGGEDLDKYVGAPRLVRALGSEVFETRAGGEVVKAAVPQGEVVWCDDVGVTCRVWNWRQGPRTALSEETTSALFILDVLTEGCGLGELDRAVEALVGELKALGGEVVVEQRRIGL